MNNQRITNILGWVVFGLSLSLYLMTLEPVASFWDSGEYIASSYKLEIPHPPGGPLFLLLGRMFSFFSMGDPLNVAMAVNALSAVSSAFAIMFLCWTIIRISRKLQSKVGMVNEYLAWGAGVIGAISFACTDTFWYSATETELYGIATGFIAFVFWAIFKWEEKADTAEGNRWLILICFVIGLSVGIHLLSLLAIPSLGLVYYFKKYRQTTKTGVFLALLLSGGFLLFVLYGLVTLANISKYAEILLVNSFGLPFGSGVLLGLMTLLGALVYGIHYSVKHRKVNLNTLLLGISFVMIGYMSYGIVLVRANFSPPINQNDPRNVLGLIYYLNMEQYPTRPLLYGKYFNAPLLGYEKGKPQYYQKDGRYEVKDHGVDYNYADEYKTILPRMYSSLKAEDAENYRKIMGLREGETPSFSDNLAYMVKHQMGHMFMRYFMWNFAGKEGSQEGAGWLTPLSDTETLPDEIRNDMARNNYYLLPLLLGILGMIFMYRRDKQLFFVNGLLFLMTGFILVMYLNGPPTEPRERDYIYVGSYFAFAVWLGIGAMAVVEFLTKLLTAKRARLALASGLAVCLAVPAILLTTNFDDHDRSERYLSVLQARNTLASCEENAILFTGGDNDTYPLWYVQEVEGFRTDVRVVVLSYANVDWYIHPMFEQKNESAPLPLSLSKEDYRQGGLIDYAFISESPQFKGKAVQANKFLELVKKRYKGIINETPLGEMVVVPARSFYSISDTSKLPFRDDIPAVAADKLVDRFDYQLKGGSLNKNDMLIMDILDSNHWERPIYFNFTSLNQVNLNLRPNTVQVGDIFRVLPLDADKTGGQPLIDTARMYQNLLVNSSYKNMNREDIHFAGNYVFFTQNRRNQLNTLMQELIKDGDLDTARDVLHQSLELFPDEAVPVDFAGIEMINIAMQLDDKDTANDLSNKLYTRADQWLTHVSDKPELAQERKTSLSLYTVSELSRLYRRYGDIEQAKRFNALFEQHYRG